MGRIALRAADATTSIPEYKDLKDKEYSFL